MCLIHQCKPLKANSPSGKSYFSGFPASTTASASISINHSGSIKRETCIIVLTGRMLRELYHRGSSAKSLYGTVQAILAVTNPTTGEKNAGKNRNGPHRHSA